MKLWLISQDVNNGYDTYDSAVVACETEEEARLTHPSKNYKWVEDAWAFHYSSGRVIKEGTETRDWCSPEDVKVKPLGEAYKGLSGVVCRSFNAG